eukprot:CAMPEP_0198204028 /NCGR_PEP_ID=MMETSP1445-20131203/7386_1 /TAXON_ID=36898 /ORGANISM="Pyramimonas sp., Strain CCMP2087" /LENGTH=378 /DNA_ID=CAMNT_0043875693 /DNA_START=146 /DNA_END=1282 /DNA_ORIENTATION=-
MTRSAMTAIPSYMRATRVESRMPPPPQPGPQPPTRRRHVPKTIPKLASRSRAQKLFHPVRLSNVFSRTSLTCRSSAGAEVKVVLQEGFDPATNIQSHESLQSGEWGLFEDDKVYGETFKVRSYEVGADGKASIPTLARIMQECATNHALRVGLCSEDGYCVDATMASQKLIWMLTKMRIRIDEYPVWGSAIETSTFFGLGGKITARRDWILTDAKTGSRLAGSTSTWVLVSTETRKIARFPSHMAETYKDKSCGDKWALGVGQTTQKIPDVEQEANFYKTLTGLRPRFTDIDMNDHINNVIYIEWILEALPKNIWQEAKLSEVDLEWCSEGDVNVLIDSEISVDHTNAVDGETLFLHRLTQNGKAVFRARTRFQHVAN